MKYREGLSRVVEMLYELLSMSLGLPPEYMKNMNYAKTQPMFFHYYPPCPEPEVTTGVRMHTDPTFITVLLQDDLGGLQVLHDGYMVDVTPIPGALVVNIGDLLEVHIIDQIPERVQLTLIMHIKYPVKRLFSMQLCLHID